MSKVLYTETKLNLNVIFLITSLLFLDTSAQLLFKVGVTHLGEFPVDSISSIAKYCFELLTNPYVLSGIIALIFAFFTWLLLIANIDLSYAHPITSLVFATIPLSSSWLFNELLNGKQLFGMALIVIGVFVVSDDKKSLK